MPQYGRLGQADSPVPGPVTSHDQPLYYYAYVIVHLGLARPVLGSVRKVLERRLPYICNGSLVSLRSCTVL